ncbi:MAG: DUF4178 domain-containing protein [Cyanobacteria bacterium]|nr:DUF4178 domain-containing protein [Cyanobacteriota bacterium]
MLTLNCSSCGAEVSFRSKASVFAVCSFCQSTLVRRDMDLELIGKMSYLLDDLTPLQIGTTGSYDGERFELIGRMKVGYDDGFWNEWYCLFPKGREGWLAEAQGFYGICFPYFGFKPPKRTEKIEPGRFFDLGDEGLFQVEDVREVRCLLSEGELPMNAAQGRASLSVDLTAKGARMATIEIVQSRSRSAEDEDESRVFVGAYKDFDEFDFQNLRKIYGW